jgi:hypothetical protein
MSRHTIAITIDSPADMSANQATAFVAGAIDTVRGNYLAMQRTGMLNGSADKFAENLGGSVIVTALQSPMRAKFALEVGAELQNDIAKLIEEKDGMLPAPARGLAQDIIDIVMRSQLVHPEARALYEVMPDTAGSVPRTQKAD